MTNLFRKEAVHHATRRLAGEVILASSVPTIGLVVLLVVIILGGTAFAATATYARKETVLGWLSPRAGLIRINAQQGGIVEDLAVAEGDTVAVGQTIATMRLSPELAGGDSFNSLEESLAAQTVAGENRNLAALASLNAERAQLIDRREALRKEVVETRRRVTLQDQRLEIAKADVTRAETIAARGYLPRRELDALRSQALATELQASELATTVLALEREIGEVSARLSAIPIDVRNVQAETEAARAGLDQQRTQTQAQSSYRVVATVAGRVAALPVAKGQSVPGGAALAVITPGDSALEAELYAPSRAAGFVTEGQEVRLMYQAFPHQKFGTGEGTVVSISRTALAPNEVAVPGLTFQEPVFRVRVRMARETVSAYGRNIPLQPGMVVSADVVIDRRSLLEWLLDPLYAAGRR